MSRYLAHFNYARLAWPVDDPRVADFLKGREPIRRIAEASTGFIWKQEAGAGEGNVEDPRLLLSLSVWESVQALWHFTWNTLHKRFYLRREDWFQAHDGPNMVLWWVKPDERPTHEQGWDRLAHLERNGDSDHAFGWSWVTEAQTAERIAAE